MVTELQKRLRIERAMCQRFREHAQTYLSDVERTYLTTRWMQLVVMQHYGAPTRLLDWTKSPWVAAFFAVSDGWRDDDDGYIYVFRHGRFGDLLRSRVGREVDGFVWGPHPTDLDYSDPKWDEAQPNDELFKDSIVSDLKEWVAVFHCRGAHFPRLVAQQGLFTFASRPQVCHWKAIWPLLGEESRWVFQIARNAKPEILRSLNSVGLNAATLFPGADGVGRSLDGYARAWHLGPAPAHL
jgi:hypothetical protein